VFLPEYYQLLSFYMLTHLEFLYTEYLALNQLYIYVLVTDFHQSHVLLYQHDKKFFKLVVSQHALFILSAFTI